jgi:elongation factor P
VGVSIGTLRSSNTIIYNNELYIIIECEHAKLGRGAAFCRVKLKNLRNSQILDCTLRDSDNIEPAFIEKRKLQYMYKNNEFYHFIDQDTYEDLALHKSGIEDKIPWLKDNLELSGIYYKDELINLDLPPSVALKVIETEPGFRGDTVKSGTKIAKLETGLTINVPLFINIGETIAVDTRTNEYLGRV